MSSYLSRDHIHSFVHIHTRPDNLVQNFPLGSLEKELIYMYIVLSKYCEIVIMYLRPSYLGTVIRVCYLYKRIYAIHISETFKSLSNFVCVIDIVICRRFIGNHELMYWLIIRVWLIMDINKRKQ